MSQKLSYLSMCTGCGEERFKTVGQGSMNKFNATGRVGPKVAVYGKETSATNQKPSFPWIKAMELKTLT